MKLKLKKLLTFVTAAFLLVCMTTVAFAQESETAQTHSSHVCGECGKELIKCNDTIIKCDQYHCPDSLCPNFESHMIDTVIVIIVTILFGITFISASLYGVSRSTAEGKACCAVAFVCAAAFAISTIGMIVYTVVRAVPELSRAIEFLSSH